ncbi:MAG: M20 family metallo-hydrolase [Chitinophagaceae bacterium]|nr:M20 family metallo-hydrolase [Chitinophagaceae bacterium]
MIEPELLQQQAIALLKELIAIPSYSKEEDRTADTIEKFLLSKAVITQRHGNNIWAINKFFDTQKPTILLNSHHDTVKQNAGYTINPFLPVEKDGKLFGLGSNDAGGCLVALIATFIYFYNNEDLKYNLVLAATAEEEISGHNGIESLLQDTAFLKLSSAKESPSPFQEWCAIVGEPTRMQMAVAEKGLLVLDCSAHGKAGHAARDEGENAIYKAMNDIEWFKNFHFPKISELLGPVKMTITSIETENKAHNVIPATCNFIVDIRVNELYTFDEVIAVISSHVTCDVRPRSVRLRSSSILPEHPLVKAGLAIGRSYYGSPTTSDKALVSFPALKMGPGNSVRSHTADEYIFTDEIKEGIAIYIQLLKKIL